MAGIDCVVHIVLMYVSMIIIPHISGKKENSAEDRLCSTAVAVNALLYTWTENQKLLPNTPQKVRTVINNASQWLVKHALSDKYKAFNVIFSGSVKTVDVSKHVVSLYSVHMLKFLVLELCCNTTS